VSQWFGRLRSFGMKQFLFAIFCGILLAPGVGSASSLTVAAASDLAGAFTELGKAFEKKTGVVPVFSFGSSGMLARQIENGAPFDVFASADVAFVEALRAKELIVADSVRHYAVGRIGIVTRKGLGLRVESLAALKSPQIRKVAIANPDHAPYGKAAREALVSAGLWEQVRAKVVYGENIRQALQFVMTGNADAGISALSLYNPDETAFTLLDASLHNPLRQGLGIVKSSRNKEAARAFADFLVADEGRKVLKKYGFETP